MTHKGDRQSFSLLFQFVGIVACLAAIPGFAWAQQPKDDGNKQAINQDSLTITVVVTAQKEPEPAQLVPLSITAVTAERLADANIQGIRQGSAYSPNTFINEFTARALSNPYFRGIGGSPTNPGVSTVIDGVPQLNSYSSNIELIDVGQIEFVRGPEGALYGRNTAGGLISIASRGLSDTWTARAEADFGNYSRRDLRGSISSGLLKDRFSINLAGGYSARDGYTVNDLTRRDLDNRMTGFGKGQFFFRVNDRLKIRLIFSSEHDGDGDYALGDLGYILDNPHHVSRDFAGYNDRSVGSATLIADYRGRALDFSSITGGVWWENHGLTDLDYQTATLENHGLYAIRDNLEEQHQVSQEFRLASSRDKPVRISDALNLNWQAGVFLFSQDYGQNALNSISSIYDIFPARADSTSAGLEDWGTGIYGRASFTAWDKLNFSAGFRFDYEDKSAELASSSAPPTSPTDSFSEVSPQFSIGYRFTSNQTAYVSASRGFKAGGFNPAPAGIPAPAGTESYQAEHTWNYELGHKARWLDGRLETAAALFYIDWDNLQLNQQIPFSGGQYFIGNAGSANSKGFEFEAKYRPYPWWELFGMAGYTRARFLSGSSAFNANIGENQQVGGHTLPYTPTFNGNAGTQISWSPWNHWKLFLRVQVSGYGDFQYDASNAVRQKSYNLVNFRGGVRARRWFAEGWADNAFDTHYIPIAIPYAQLGAPSGYVGESGAPVTYGARAGITF